MTTQLFVNFPTDDLDRARTFYEAIGWTINPQFSDENAICVVIDEDAYLMILRREFYATFIEGKMVGDPSTTSQAIVSFTLPARQDVDPFLRAVSAAGGKSFGLKDYGFMLQGAFDDPDGHHFEPFWMDPDAAESGPEAFDIEE